MRQSMTGFAARDGAAESRRWSWELRGVNNKGLDLRLRLPDAAPGLEAAVRAALADRVTRGSVQVSLKLVADADDATPRVDPAQLDAALEALRAVEAAAQRAKLDLAPPRGADILALRGVLTTDPAPADADALHAALLADFDAALTDFTRMRAEEGARLARIVQGHLDEIAALLDTAADAAAARAPRQADRLRAQLARVTQNAEGVDAQRVAQELALIATRADITEEIDRLQGHVAAARALLAEDGAVGRKLDFLCQEFNREANTLCSKSGDAALTNAGLALKTVIEQMREQIQNLE